MHANNTTLVEATATISCEALAAAVVTASKLAGAQSPQFLHQISTSRASRPGQTLCTAQLPAAESNFCHTFCIIPSYRILIQYLPQIPKP